jgi:hypothetical protein
MLLSQVGKREGEEVKRKDREVPQKEERLGGSEKER